MSVGYGRARHLLPGLTSGARTGKATGIGPGTVRPFRYQLRVARPPVTAQLPPCPELGPSRMRLIAHAEATLLHLPESLARQQINPGGLMGHLHPYAMTNTGRCRGTGIGP